MTTSTVRQIVELVVAVTKYRDRHMRIDAFVSKIPQARKSVELLEHYHARLMCTQFRGGQGGGVGGGGSLRIPLHDDGPRAQLGYTCWV